jgi:ABC-type multidrug transport system permease subunit
LAGNSLGLFLGSVINNARSISIAMSLIILPVILFSGYFKNTGDLPDWIGWI